MFSGFGSNTVDIKMLMDEFHNSRSFKVASIGLIVLIILANYYFNFKSFSRLRQQATTLLYLLFFGLNIVYLFLGSNSGSPVAKTYSGPDVDPCTEPTSSTPNYGQNRPNDASDQPTARKVTNLQKKIVAARQKWRCGHCGTMLDETFEVDHIKALYQGGTNDLSNLIALDPICHRKKTFRQQWVGGRNAVPLNPLTQ